MGRYAEFETGFSYKFGFASQSSYDITEFYGVWEKDLNYSENDISWTQDDKEKIFEKLRSMQKENLSLPDINFDMFPLSLQGTNELREFFYKVGCQDFKYELGCYIYHQLLYTEHLKCSFEF